MLLITKKLFDNYKIPLAIILAEYFVKFCRFLSIEMLEM